MSGDVDVSALNRSSALIDLGRYAQAAEQLSAILSTDPHHARALCLLARARLGLGDDAGAQAAAEAAIAAHPDDEWPYRIASVAMQRRGLLAGSVRMARTAVTLAPFLSDAHARLAFALAAAHQDLAEARRSAEKAVELNPHSVEAQLAVGSVAVAAGRRNDARDAYNRALALDPTSAQAHNELARLHLQRRKFGNGAGLAQAASGFATALRSDPNQKVSRRNLDLVLHVFLARLAYYVFLVAFVGRSFAGSNVHSGVLWIPAITLVFPAFFVVRFLLRLSSELRPYLWRSLRSPLRAVGVAALSAACILLFVGPVRPGVAAGAFVASFVLSLAARFTLYKERQRDGFNRPRRRRER